MTIYLKARHARSDIAVDSWISSLFIKLQTNYGQNASDNVGNIAPCVSCHTITLSYYTHEYTSCACALLHITYTWSAISILNVIIKTRPAYNKTPEERMAYLVVVNSSSYKKATTSSFVFFIFFLFFMSQNCVVVETTPNSYPVPRISLLILVLVL